MAPHEFNVVLRTTTDEFNVLPRASWPEQLLGLCITSCIFKRFLNLRLLEARQVLVVWKSINILFYLIIQDFDIDLEGAQTLRLLCYKVDKDSSSQLIGKCAFEVNCSSRLSKLFEFYYIENAIEMSMIIAILASALNSTLLVYCSYKLNTFPHAAMVCTSCQTIISNKLYRGGHASN